MTNLDNLNRVFYDLQNEPFGFFKTQTLKCDSYFNGSNYVVEVAVPGFTKDDLEALDTSYGVRIKGERQIEQKLKRNELLKKIDLNIDVPEGFHYSKITCKVEHGILRVEFFKEEERGTTIEIE